jgi:hypothetical protein
MPASSAQTPPHATNDSSVSPDPQSAPTSEMSRDDYTPNQQLNLPHHDRPANGISSQRLMEPPAQSFGPPPVDFTNYTSAPALPPVRPYNELPPLLNSAASASTNSRKRTHSETGERSAPLANSNASSIDPNLSSYARRAESQVDAMTDGASNESREDRRERIRRERDRLAEQVAAMNRQLAEMEEETG